MAKVLIYSTPTCPYCKQAKAYFKENNLEFEDIDVSDDAAKATEMQEKSSQLGVPVIDIDGKILVGFNKTELEEALKGAGLLS